MDLPTTHYDQPKEAQASRIPAAGSRDSLLKKISFYVFLALIFLAPLAFIPSFYAPLDVVKTLFVALAVLLAAALYAISNLKKPTFTLPRSAVGYAAGGIILSLLISTLLSSSISKSFIGQGFEMGTASFILVLFLACGMVKRYAVEDKEASFQIYTTFFISFLILALFHVVRFFGGADFLNVGILSTLTSTIAGKWYDFAILTGAAALLSLVAVKFLPLRKGLKHLLFAALVLSGVLLFFINASFLWASIAVIALLIGAYEYSFRGQKGNSFKSFASRVSLLTLAVFVIAAVCAWKGDMIAAPAMRGLGLQYVEPALPWQETLDVTVATLKESPLFGAGPNRFGYQYLRFKPLSVNETPFWNVEFPNGFGLLPTFVATQGIVGALLWLVFFILIFREGIRALRKTMDPVGRFLLTSSFFVTVFLWLESLIYVPSQATLLMTFVFTGLFIASLVRDGQLEDRELSAKNESSKFMMAGAAVIALLLVLWLGTYAKKAVAITYFQKGIKTLSGAASAEAAENNFKKALAWDASDVYYQALSEINIVKVGALAREMDAAGAPDEKKIEQIRDLVAESLAYAKSAEKIDPNNHYNYIAEAHVAEVGTSLKFPNAYENTKLAYTAALKNNPYNPAAYLSLARLEASQGKYSEGEAALGRALQLKPNYTEAIFFLSQLQVAANKLDDAIISTQVAIDLNPEEPLLYFQLGLLQYNNKNYSASIAALEKAVSLNSQYANARYFLGLAYARMGNTEKATAQFKELAATNPDNKEVAFILENLQEGKSPFAQAVPPIDSKPEQRKTLPVAEKPVAAAKKKTN